MFNLELLDRSLNEARAALFNRLEEAALSAVPALASWREVLDRSAAGHFRLAGSGSSFFGLFANPIEARRVLEGVARAAHQRGLAARFTSVAQISGLGARLDP